MSIGPLDLVSAGFQVVGGVVNYFDARKDKKQLHEKLRKSKARLDASKEAFKNLDTSNPYLNMQNVYEDMTVNQQEAEFTRQQQFQNQANILQQLRGAAGASGIAGLAQALANQGALDAQKAAVSIGKQEASIQEKKLGEESKLQGLEREGDLISRQAEASKLGSLMAMDAQEVAAQRLAQQQAKERMAQAFGGIGSGIIDLAAASEV
jgi:hypothetical protein